MKFGICQELFEGWDWKRQCRRIAEIGYTGVEIAPFSICSSPQALSEDDRLRLRGEAETAGLEVIGLHWLLAKTTGMHVTAPDAGERKSAVEYLVQLGELCADLGGKVLVFGSPHQRSRAPGVSRQQAMDAAAEVFQSVLARIEHLEVDLLIEPLTENETNFINSCDEAEELIRAVNHPRFGLHQDVKAMLAERTPIPELIRRHAGSTRHFHANDSNLLGPGMGETDFGPIFQALLDTNYSGWVSVEVFDYSPGAEWIAEESLRCMQETLVRCQEQ